MRAVVVIGRDGPDPSRRAARRDAHIAAIEGFAREGVLLLGLPLHARGRSVGSLMVVDAAAIDDYLAREPFASGGVWQDIARRPAEIPSLPWQPWPAADAPLSSTRGHTIVIVEGAAEPERMADAAASGVLAFAARMLDRPGAVLVTAHGDDDAALAWTAAEPALRGSKGTPWATLFRPLPYRPLPRPG